VGYFGFEHAARLDPTIAVPQGARPLPDAWWAVLEPRSRGTLPAAVGGGVRRRPVDLEVSLDADAFKGGVEAIRDRIAAGEVYQVNLTRRWSTPARHDPAALFLRLLGRRAPRFATYLEDREQGWAVLCLSPELLLGRRGDRVETRPIKGTRPLHRRGDAGRQLRGLRRSGKDRAELAMIVDLERNDLGRVCRPGTVRVERAAASLETLDVVHLEARVVGRLEPQVGLVGLLEAVLPGGSVTGAPKVAACQVIAALEPVPRSVYCGAIGILRGDGDLTLALAIRTAYQVGGQLHFHAGCGVVWDSDPAAEERESRAKVRSFLRELGCA
jgi:anthranilate/para-aminobenzoate synthase component I